MADYREFLRVLRREPGRVTLFEPYIHRKIVSQLIWRSGDNLWDTTAHRVSTLIDLYAYIKSDVVPLEANREDIADILACSPMLPDGMRFVILSEDADALHIAAASDAVCALGTGDIKLPRESEKPMIFLADSGDTNAVAEAAAQGFDGVHISQNAEMLYPLAKGQIALLGGLSIEDINVSEPMVIHRRIKALHTLTADGGYALGSGNCYGETSYLGFISMLGIYNQLLN
ncbi:MAG: hypothetical protein IJ493_07545 [Clostridia bacterium]|nr:hypothetical protein [Clostridia bacterium]